MSYSLTINFTPPTGNGYQFVNGDYRIKYWPTSSPANVSTVFTRAFPLVLTDLNSTSYSGTIEAKCGDIYGSPRSFGPVVIAGSGGGGGTTPACPYRVVLYEDESVSYPIGASGNATSCVKPGYRIKLTTEGGVLVTTSTELTVGVTYTVETGDCASPISTETLSTTLTIPAGSSISSGAAGTTSTCYNYSVVGNNGTNNKDTIDWSYVTCAGVTEDRTIVNAGGSQTVCARAGSIDGSVDETQGTACGSVIASGGYLQVTQANQRITNVTFSVGNPTTLVNGALTCNLTYTGGGSALPTRTVYLNAVEYNTAPNATVRWYLSNQAGGMQLTLGNLLPFNIRIAYAITGTGVSGGNGNTSQEVIISGLDFPAGESSVSQGTTGTNWYSMRNTNLRFSGTSTFDYSVNGIEVFNSSGGSVNNPVTYTFNGTIYTIHVYRDYTLAY
jgi:hypothetical protein